MPPSSPFDCPAGCVDAAAKRPRSPDGGSRPRLIREKVAALAAIWDWRIFGDLLGFIGKDIYWVRTPHLQFGDSSENIWTSSSTRT